MKQRMKKKKILTQKNKNMLDGQTKSGVCCECKKRESRMRQEWDSSEEKSHKVDELKNLDTQIKDVPSSFIGNVISYGCAHYYETMWYATEKIWQITVYYVMAVPTIPTSAVNDNKSKMFTHSTFSVHFLTWT